MGHGPKITCEFVCGFLKFYLPLGGKDQITNDKCVYSF